MTTVRSSRRSNASIALVVLSFVAAGDRLSAHRLDELLQAARIGVEPDRVDIELTMTPGAAIVDAWIADIDRDRDGVLSPRERDGYVAAVAQEVAVDVDGRALPVRIVAANVPQVDQLRQGSGIVTIRLVATLPLMTDGAHALRFVNRHRGEGSVYLANALVPESDRVAITAQDRDGDQRELTIKYVQTAERQSLMPFSLLMTAAALLLTIAMRRQWRRVVIP